METLSLPVKSWGGSCISINWSFKYYTRGEIMFSSFNLTVEFHLNLGQISWAGIKGKDHLLIKVYPLCMMKKVNFKYWDRNITSIGTCKSTPTFLGTSDTALRTYEPSCIHLPSFSSLPTSYLSKSQIQINFFNQNESSFKAWRFQTVIK